MSPLVPHPANTSLTLGGKAVDPNFLNGTVQLTPVEGQTVPLVVVLLRTGTDGKRAGEAFEFDGAVAVSKHTCEVFGGTDGGRPLAAVRTIYVLTPAPAKQK